MILFPSIFASMLYMNKCSTEAWALYDSYLVISLYVSSDWRVTFPTLHSAWLGMNRLWYHVQWMRGPSITIAMLNGTAGFRDLAPPCPSPLQATSCAVQDTCCVQIDLKMSLENLHNHQGFRSQKVTSLVKLWVQCWCLGPVSQLGWGFNMALRS